MNQVQSKYKASTNGAEKKMKRVQGGTARVVIEGGQIKLLFLDESGKRLFTAIPTAEMAIRLAVSLVNAVKQTGRKLEFRIEDGVRQSLDIVVLN